jgi:arginine/lysine/ornithine decarboxylase
LLIAQGVAVNAYLARRDSVTVGTDDDGPALRTAVVALATASVLAVAMVGYRHWTVPDREGNADRSAVTDVVATVAEAVVSFSPGSPDSYVHKAAEHMTEGQRQSFTRDFDRATAELKAKGISQQGEIISVGIEALGPEDAVAAALVRRTSVAAKTQPEESVLALRMSLAKRDGRWLVDNIAPIDRMGAAPSKG